MTTDALLIRIERNAMLICATMALLALVLARGRPAPALAVVAGGLLTGVSYWLLKGGVSGLVSAMAAHAEAEKDAPVPRPRTVLKLVGRYALLGLMAYVMIARLRLHPLGLLAGASSIVAAVTVEAVRLLVKKP